jgi:hypothetical protein
MGIRFYELIFVAALYVFAIAWWVRAFRRASSDGLKVISGPYDETIRILEELPRPRPIRIGSKGKWITLIVLVVPLAVFTFAAYDQHRHPTPGMTMEGLLEFFGIMPVFMGAILWLPPYLRDKALVSEGDLAIGEITRLDSGRIIYVYYEFETPFGQRVKKMSTTFRIDLAPGMKTPVFYNRENPKKAIALCTAFYDVVLPVKGNLDPHNSR